MGIENLRLKVFLFFLHESTVCTLHLLHYITFIVVIKGLYTVIMAMNVMVNLSPYNWVAGVSGLAVFFLGPPWGGVRQSPSPPSVDFLHYHCLHPAHWSSGFPATKPFTWVHDDASQLENRSDPSKQPHLLNHSSDFLAHFASLSLFSLCPGGDCNPVLVKPVICARLPLLSFPKKSPLHLTDAPHIFPILYIFM